MEKGIYAFEIHELGDHSNVPESNGPVYSRFASCSSSINPEKQGEILLSADETGTAKLACTIYGLTVQELIGRSTLVRTAFEHGSKQVYLSGIIARSAGLFENTKSVCSCTGKTLWEEDQQIRSSD
ncbi:hypothetical protein BB560_005744 [Smittium megazygosporum]|uniref:Superoxide dismutase copper/zinc binding domain-containing protein n=1 Tax=Smittium megazygosporum TaxID=133381 RepID=A0A2T9YYI3_9FUNG|nr:hypothetical protein BB560_005744 [Smittium megazygosporum]